MMLRQKTIKVFKQFALRRQLGCWRRGYEVNFLAGFIESWYHRIPWIHLYPGSHSVKQVSTNVSETHAAFIFKVDWESSVQGSVQ
jgi:hypothetical protein